MSAGDREATRVAPGRRIATLLFTRTIMPLNLFRAFLLVLGVLAVLSALVLDGVLVRFLWQPLTRYLETHSPRPVRYPPGMRFMLAHGWARRTYNLGFAFVVFGIWWYLGTPAGSRFGP